MPVVSPAAERLNLCAAWLDEGAAAVDDQDLTCYEIGLGKVRDSFGYVFACAGAMQGDAPDVICVGGFVGKLDGAGGDAVDQDFRAEGAGQAAGEHDGAGFGHAVVRVAGPR